MNKHYSHPWKWDVVFLKQMGVFYFGLTLLSAYELFNNKDQKWYHLLICLLLLVSYFTGALDLQRRFIASRLHLDKDFENPEGRQKIIELYHKLVGRRGIVLPETFEKPRDPGVWLCKITWLGAHTGIAVITTKACIFHSITMKIWIIFAVIFFVLRLLAFWTQILWAIKESLKRHVANLLSYLDKNPQKKKDLIDRYAIHEEYLDKWLIQQVSLVSKSGIHPDHIDLRQVLFKE